MDVRRVCEGVKGRGQVASLVADLASRNDCIVNLAKLEKAGADVKRRTEFLRIGRVSIEENLWRRRWNYIEENEKYGANKIEQER